MSWAVEERPQRLSELVGQPSLKAVLQRLNQRSEWPTALLLSGVRGIGKTSAARIEAAAAVAPDGQGDVSFNSPEALAVFNGKSNSLIEIDAASHGLVDDIRSLRDMLQYSIGSHRTVVLDEVHSMSREAFNALLKVLEEPSPDTSFVLTTTEPSKLPDTIVSRCLHFELHHIPQEMIVKRLQDISISRSVEVEIALLEAIAERSHGGMRDAIMLLEQAANAGWVTEEQFEQATGDGDESVQILIQCGLGDLPQAIKLADDAWKRTGDPARILHRMTEALRDCALIAASAAPHMSVQRLQARQQLMNKVGLDGVHKMMSILWEASARLRLSERERHNLDLTVAQLCKKIPTQQQPVQSKPQTLSLSDLAELPRI